MHKFVEVAKQSEIPEGGTLDVVAAGKWLVLVKLQDEVYALESPWSGTVIRWKSKSEVQRCAARRATSRLQRSLAFSRTQQNQHATRSSLPPC
jgi:hypothetical protein